MNINQGELVALIHGTIFAGRLQFHPVLDSTNTSALRAANAGAPEGTAIVAGEQTHGRGRGGHAWHSEAGAGLYLSVVLRPQLPADQTLFLSLMAGLAAQTTVKEVAGAQADLRWPNDLLLGDKKIGGILTEMASEGETIRHAVVGIGINVNHAAFPPELAPIATSLRLATGREWPREALLGALLQSLDREYRALQQAGAAIIARFEAASSYARGKRVRVGETGGYTGVTEGLDARGFLRVRTADGLRTVISGDVRPAEE